MADYWDFHPFTVSPIGSGQLPMLWLGWFLFEFNKTASSGSFAVSKDYKLCLTWTVQSVEFGQGNSAEYDICYATL